DRQLERHRLAEGRAVQLDRFRDRLSRIDADAELIDLSLRLAPSGDGRTLTEGPTDDFAGRTEPAGSVRAGALDDGGRGGEAAGVPPGAAGADAGQRATATPAAPIAIDPADAGAAAPTGPEPVAPDPVQRALQRIAGGNAPAAALEGLADA